MNIRVKHQGEILTGDSFVIEQFSGAPEDLTDTIREIASYNQITRADGGDWFMVIDDQAFHIDAGNHPDLIHIDGEAQAIILNYSELSDDYLTVVRQGPGEHADRWLTIIDNEVVESGEFHPARITAGDV